MNFYFIKKKPNYYEKLLETEEDYDDIVYAGKDKNKFFIDLLDENIVIFYVIQMNFFISKKSNIFPQLFKMVITSFKNSNKIFLIYLLRSE